MKKRIKYILLFILSIFLFIGGIFILITSINSYSHWKIDLKNYSKEFVFVDSDNKILYYENDGEKISVDTIYNSKKEKLSLNMKRYDVAIMYCDKEKVSECIYIGSDDDAMFSKSDLFSNVLGVVILVVLGLCIIGFNTFKKVYNNRFTITGYFLSFILAIVGVCLIVYEIYNLNNYYNIKNQNNKTTAAVIGKIYKPYTDSSYYPVAFYSVDGKFYYYVIEDSIEEDFKDYLGKEFELLYDSKNPSIVISVDYEDGYTFLIVGMLILISALYITFGKQKK